MISIIKLITINISITNLQTITGNTWKIYKYFSLILKAMTILLQQKMLKQTEKDRSSNFLLESSLKLCI